MPYFVLPTPAVDAAMVTIVADTRGEADTGPHTFTPTTDLRTSLDPAR